MAKPVGAACNLACGYCFYRCKADPGAAPGAGRMSDSLLETYVREYLRAHLGPEVTFTWQGGEPTLAGLDFYHRAVELQRRYARPGQRIANDLQTNGILIDDEWCRFLKQYGFWVGLSIDGPRELHDAYRAARDGQPSFDRARAAFELLRAHGVPVNTLTVVNNVNAKRPLDVYRFLVRELKSDRIQFIPCVQHRSFAQTAPQHWSAADQPAVGTPPASPRGPGSVVTDRSVDPEQYGAFLCEVFDDWYRHDIGTVFVNLFETLVSQHLGLGPQMCVFGPTCGQGLVVEHDGGIYACDHYVYPEYRLGSLGTQSVVALAGGDRQRRFGEAKSALLPACCRACAHLADCWGECPKNRFLRAPDGEPGLNYLCPGLKRFFAHAVPVIETVVARMRRGEW